MDVTDHPERHRFELPVGGGDVAVASYELSPGVIAITHVIVPAHAEGRGVGSKLTAHALDAARERGLKVVPFAPSLRLTSNVTPNWRTCWRSPAAR